MSNCIKKILPKDFNSWIQFYDYLYHNYPYLHGNITSLDFDRNGNPSPSGGYVINMTTIIRNCWREVMEDRFANGTLKTYEKKSDWKLFKRKRNGEI